MSNIYDVHAPGSAVETMEEPVKRSRKRSAEQLSKAELRAGQRTLFAMVERAFETLEDAMATADHQTAIKAAQIILDRTGFGPKSTVEVNSTHLDLTEMTRDQLADRAAQLAVRLREKNIKTIEATPVTVQ
jgi:hypothetical protein